MTTPTNLQHAAGAESALYACSDEKVTVPLRPKELYDHKQYVLTDLLGDLMHYADVEDGIDFRMVLERARRHHEAERAGEAF